MVGIEGIKLVKYFEGLKLTAYTCPAGVWTIGYGHTKNVFGSMVITEEEATHYLYEDLLLAEMKVERYLERNVNTNQKDALISNAYNLSTYSTRRLVRYANVSDDLYLEKVLLYHKDQNGTPLLGLKKRRKAEALLFAGMKWNEIKKII